MSWVEAFNGGSSQTFLIQYRPDLTSSWTNLTSQFPEKGLYANHTANISDLKPGTNYRVKLVAYNMYGYSECPALRVSTDGTYLVFVQRETK